jgi:acyl-CoA synthetase (AMP-forming)/AMP-acid ligase II
MSRQKISHYTGVINVIWMMINHPDFEKYDFSSFKVACFGGSPASEEMVRGIMGKLPNLRMSVGYGLTESHAMISTTPYADALRKVNAVGKMLALGDAKVVDDDRNELPAGSAGEILLKGAKIFKGYWNNPVATREAMADGWLRTGDIGKIDDEGFLYILDRKKDMINRGGEKIYSLEVENLIFNYPKVLEVAVVGAPDSVLGEAVKAVIALKPGETASEEEIRKFCAEHLADYKVPKFIEFVDSLPRNPAGKVVKAELRRPAKSTAATQGR